ncbi:hypothetical protein BDV38DRAFT_249790 [Aspergillus pseudotamarii]|uniref:Uncharacterized protein n=1 Tax=Aspergillus pseudotamarii TaxID=132259 RepID=A0A5N6SNN3_ASPPS|nr:uncharacterized protein BDV38DRAFT_249790 [Aspergillus pseudotamarii]KAE8136292.1 hypothetical protein BDV38DRAFT_249790 [Aspergillus pseudotamarii]
MSALSEATLSYYVCFLPISIQFKPPSGVHNPTNTCYVCRMYGVHPTSPRFTRLHLTQKQKPQPSFLPQSHRQPHPPSF